MAFEELKQKQGVMWSSGPYQNVTDTIADIHARVVERLAPPGGERWLDLACGTAAVAEQASRAGAQVTGVDLVPALIDTARERSRELGLEIDYRVGDCERLEDIADGSFDIVSSTCGVMFAPDHEAAASELARVTKSGGRLGLVNWDPDGGLGKMFAMMKRSNPRLPRARAFPSTGVAGNTFRSCSATTSSSSSRTASRRTAHPVPRSTGRCSRRATGRRRRPPTRSTTNGERSSTAPGSTSSSRTTWTTAALPTHGSTSWC